MLDIHAPLISQADAARILGLSKTAVGRAVSNGVLTAVMQGERCVLDEDQVRLFIGKKRLSLKSLSERELVEWSRLADRHKAPSEQLSSEVAPVSHNGVPTNRRLEEAILVGNIFAQVAAAQTRPLADAMERMLSVILGVDEGELTTEQRQMLEYARSQQPLRQQ